MARTKTTFKKGEGGRHPGTPNRTTREAKELLEQILLGQVDNIKAALEKINKDDPARYLDACSKLFTYVLPRKTDVTSGDKPIQPITGFRVIKDGT